MPEPVVPVSPAFETMIEQLRAYAGSETARFDPTGHGPGPLVPWSGITDDFPREDLDEGLLRALADPAASGVTGDLAVASLQMDYMAVLERAYRQRTTMSPTRARVLSRGRREGHAHAQGTFARVLEQARGLARAAAAGDNTAGAPA